MLEKDIFYFSSNQFSAQRVKSAVNTKSTTKCHFTADMYFYRYMIIPLHISWRVIYWIELYIMTWWHGYTVRVTGGFPYMASSMQTSSWAYVWLIYQGWQFQSSHYSDTIMNAMESQITGVSIVYSTVCSGGDQRKHQSSASLVFVRGIHRLPVNSPHKGPVTRKMLRHNDVMMIQVHSSLDEWQKSLHWGHMSAMASQTTGPSNVCSAAFEASNTNNDLRYYWPFVKGNHKHWWIPLTKGQ